MAQLAEKLVCNIYQKNQVRTSELKWMVLLILIHSPFLLSLSPTLRTHFICPLHLLTSGLLSLMELDLPLPGVPQEPAKVSGVLIV